MVKKMKCSCFFYWHFHVVIACRARLHYTIVWGNSWRRRAHGKMSGWGRMCDLNVSTVLLMNGVHRRKPSRRCLLDLSSICPELWCPQTLLMADVPLESCLCGTGMLDHHCGALRHVSCDVVHKVLFEQGFSHSPHCWLIHACKGMYR